MPKWLGNRFGDAVPTNPGNPAPSAIYSIFDQYYMKQEGGWDAETFSASGGTEITSGSNKYHVFTVDTPSPQQNLVVSASKTGVEILVVAGGAGGAGHHGGGGGAGGILHHSNLTLNSGTYTTTVGSGGAGAAAGPPPGNGTHTYSANGSNTYFGPSSPPEGYTSTGGGGAFPSGRNGTGGVQPLEYQNAPAGSDAFDGAGLPGGSGGGTGEEGSSPGGEGTQAPMNGATGYGNDGGSSSSSGHRTSGGGGAGSAGQDGGSPPPGAGGNGQAFPAFPAPVIAPAIPGPQQSAFTSAVGPTGLFGGGGGRGGTGAVGAGAGGPGGGGAGGAGPNPGTVGNAAVYGTGGGGGGGGGFSVGGGNGGSGIIIVLYPTS